MKRREFLKVCGTLTANMALTSVFTESLMISSAWGDPVPLLDLRKLLDPSEAQILVPTDSDFQKNNIAFNKRTMVTPAVRVMCRTAQAVSLAIAWAEKNNVPLAMRSGGHSFEGLSGSTGMVIDTRPMSKIEFGEKAATITTGAGQRLGVLYDQLAAKGVALPAGSCPFVGVTGHTMGGGYGLLARPLGLACDSLLSAEIVTSDGAVRTVSETQTPDLFWALRGAGGGSFGVVTKLEFKTHKVKNIVTFGLSWKLKIDAAAEMMGAWQEWAPKAPREITSLMKVSKDAGSGQINIRCFGETIGPETALRRELEQLTKLQAPTKKSFDGMNFIESIHHFAGDEDGYESIYMKGKSDIVKGVMSRDSLRFFLNQLPSGMAAIFDAYGGAIADKRDSDTAFAHRENVVGSVQYYMQWDDAANTKQRLQTIRTFYDSIRPHMFDAAYFNYCDLDLKNYGDAYWGKNFDRLINIKNNFDPKNLFKHAQSIPLRRT